MPKKLQGNWNEFEQIGGGSDGSTIAKPPASKPNDYYEELKNQLESSYKNNQDLLNKKNELLKEQNYKALLDMDISLNNAKEQAFKYTQNAMYASGLGTQGASETNMARQSNAYLNALQGNKSAYSEAESAREMGFNELQSNLENQKNENYLNILGKEEEKKYQEEMVAFDDLLLTIGGQGGDSDKINDIFTQLGYKDTQGNWTGKFNDLSQANRQRLENAMIGDMEGETGDVYLNLNNPDQTIEYIDENGKFTTGKLQEKFQREFDKIKNGLGGLYNVGDAIEMTNMWNGKIYVEITRNGIKVIDEAKYKKAKRQKKVTN